MNIFDECKKLKYQASMGDITKLDGVAILMFDKMLCDLFQDRKINIHCGYDPTGHVDKSFHYKGFAWDFHIEPSDLKNDFIKMDMWLRKYQIKAELGVYPWWNNKGYHIAFGSPTQDRWISTAKGVYNSKFNINEVGL